MDTIFKVYDEKLKQYLSNKSDEYEDYYVDSDGRAYVNNILLGLIQLENATVLRFTGFTDANGKKIYEKDILADRFNELGEVMWDDANGLWILETPGISFILGSMAKAYHHVASYPTIIEDLE